jgi:hypothetical protein
MSLLRSLFGPSKAEIWFQLSRKIDASFREGGLFQNAVVQARDGDWIITLDTHVVNKAEFTRLRAPFVNRDGFRFSICRTGLASGFYHFLGMQDIEIGDPLFDLQFRVTANSESKVMELLGNPHIREMIRAQPRIRLQVKDDEGWFGATFPNGVDELHFEAAGVIRDVGQLESLFELFSAVLREICHLDGAYEDDVGLLMDRLRAPGGRIVDCDELLWDGDVRRRDAVAHLARLKDLRSLPALVEVVDDADDVVKGGAIEALGEFGDAAAVPALIPLLGQTKKVGGRQVRGLAAAALGQVGAQDMVDAFDQALQGYVDPLKELAEGAYRSEIVQALIHALDTSATAPRAAAGLAALGAQEALPRLRSAIRKYVALESVRDACRSAVAELEARAALPRPARAEPEDGRDSLPRPAAGPEGGVETLPKAVEEER